MPSPPFKPFDSAFEFGRILRRVSDIEARVEALTEMNRLSREDLRSVQLQITALEGTLKEEMRTIVGVRRWAIGIFTALVLSVPAFFLALGANYAKVDRLKDDLKKAETRDAEQTKLVNEIQKMTISTDSFVRASEQARTREFVELTKKIEAALPRRRR